ncbi:unnamed protein product, partial [Rotaria sp. Silwood2]
QEKIFSDTLNFVSIDNVSSIDRCKLDRFCIDILPRVQHNVKCFILEPVSMERILLAVQYPNLGELKLFNFNQEIALNYFTNESSLRYISQQQITHLVLANNDKDNMIQSPENYNRNVYGRILKFFKNLKHFSVIETFNPSYPPLSLCHLPSTSFFSSTLTHLCVNLYILDDCLYLLDGRLKQLTILIVRINCIDESSSIIHKMDDLPNLQCFSFKCYLPINEYDQKMLPLLHRMSYLEKLTLYLRIENRATFVNNTHLQNEILVYMPRLYSFSFYISTYDRSTGLFHYVPSQDIQRTITNNRHQPMASVIS